MLWNCTVTITDNSSPVVDVFGDKTSNPVAPASSGVLAFYSGEKAFNLVRYQSGNVETPLYTFLVPPGTMVAKNFTVENEQTGELFTVDKTYAVPSPVLGQVSVKLECRRLQA